MQRSDLMRSVGQDYYLVEPLCSGFNMIMVLLSLVLPTLYLRRASARSMGAAFLWVPAVGLATKILLISITLIVSPHLGMDTSLILYHWWLGVPFFIVALGVALKILSGTPERLDLRTAGRYARV